MEYDEFRAVKFINDRLVADGRNPYGEDEVLNVIDMIWDYYEENGMLDIDADDDFGEDEDIEQDLIDYVVRMLRKDKGATVKSEDVPLMVNAEIDYEDSLD